MAQESKTPRFLQDKHVDYMRDKLWDIVYEKRYSIRKLSHLVGVQTITIMRFLKNEKKATMTTLQRIDRFIKEHDNVNTKK